MPRVRQHAEAEDRIAANSTLCTPALPAKASTVKRCFPAEKMDGDSRIVGAPKRLQSVFDVMFKEAEFSLNKME